MLRLRFDGECNQNMKKINQPQIILSIVYIIIMAIIGIKLPDVFPSGYFGDLLFTYTFSAVICLSVSLTVVFLKLFDSFKN